jgi:hypothetical protein
MITHSVDAVLNRLAEDQSVQRMLCSNPGQFQNMSRALIATNRGPVRRPLLWQGVCLLLAFLVLAYPIYVIRPFRYQGHTELAAALVVLRFRLFFQVVVALITTALAIFVWRQTGGVLRKAAAVMCALLVIAFGSLSRVNIYELMFHPLDRPTFSPAASVKLDGDEEVIAIRINRAARAYPVRSMSYHHIVNDVLGGVPVVATY